MYVGMYPDIEMGVCTCKICLLFTKLVWWCGTWVLSGLNLDKESSYSVRWFFSFPQSFQAYTRRVSEKGL
jgi:hypothetical protein